MLRKCPHHGFLELHQIDTFNNGLNQHEQDSLNVAAGGNLLRKTPRDALIIIENKSKVRCSRYKPVAFKVSTTSSGSSSSTDARIDKLTDTISNLVETFNKKMTTPATVKIVEETCVIYGGAHLYYDCISTDSNTSLARLRIKNVKNELKSDINELRNMMASYFQKGTTSTSGSGSLPSNTIANPRADLKAITTRSGVSYDAPPIPPPFSSLPKVVQRVPEVTKDTIQQSTKSIQPLVAQTQVLIDEPVVAPKPKLTIPYPSSVTKQKLREKDDNLALKVVEIFRKLHFEKLSLPELTPTQMILELADRSTNQPADIAEDIFVKVGKFHFPTDFVVVDYVVDPRVPLILGRPFLRTGRALIDVYGEQLTLHIPPGIDDTEFDLEGDIRLLDELLNNDPSSSPLPLKELNVKEIKTVKSFIDEPPELELKELPCHLEYAFLEGTDKLPIIISKELKDEENSALLKGGMTEVENEDNDLIPTRHIPKVHDGHLLRYERENDRDTNLVLNWKKCHFMVKEGIVLGHKISISRIEVDRAKVDVIAKLPHPTSVKGAENLAADHLSTLENPHQDELEKKEITETFPLETLGMIAFRGDSSTLWFANIANYHAGNFIVKEMPSQQKKKFFKDVKHYF
nr:reverse transcriptase domain-containing protein [Tanacetum cinerariifolium]